MKRLVISEQEKNRILGMHKGAIINEQLMIKPEKEAGPYRGKRPTPVTTPTASQTPTGLNYTSLKEPISVRAKNVKTGEETFVTLDMSTTLEGGCHYKGKTMGGKGAVAMGYCSQSERKNNLVSVDGQDYQPTPEGVELLSSACGCDKYVQQGGVNNTTA